jgi:hypothetical protein
MLPLKREERSMSPIKIQFNEDWTGCLDGVNPISFQAGQVADVPAHVAAVLLEDGRATLPCNTKALNGAPQNKALDGPEASKVGKQAGPVRRGRPPGRAKK